MHLNSYKVSLPIFEGPLDLLLHLIRKNDVSVADIPISLVLDQYLDYLSLMQELNIDLAGEFILMAAELTHIKSKTLLPDANEEEEEEGVDPRAELARRLLEYQRFKDAAQLLSKRTQLGREVFVRLKASEEIDQEEILQADSFKLLTAFNDILKKLKPERYHEVAVERLSVTQRIYELMERFHAAPSFTFDSLFEGPVTRGQCIVTFLAVLEMMRLKLIRIWQTETGGTIHLFKKEEASSENSQIASEFDTSTTPNSSLKTGVRAPLSINPEQSRRVDSEKGEGEETNTTTPTLQ